VQITIRTSQPSLYGPKTVETSPDYQPFRNGTWLEIGASSAELPFDTSVGVDLKRHTCDMVVPESGNIPSMEILSQWAPGRTSCLQLQA
jgi:hypothetical protein